jgi:tRNA threonylcarbamoyladenosine biosynthesis protein TsaB
LRLLALDTSTSRGSVALLEGRELVAELRLLSLETHSARLLASIDFLLKNAGWDLEDLGLIVAGIGPGSFTGIRIGVATAIGLAQTLGIPFSGVSGLDALARQLPIIDGKIGVIMDAQRGQVYYAEYKCNRGNVARSGKPSLLAPLDVLHRLRRAHIFVLGDGALRYARELEIPRAGWPRMADVDLFLAAPLGRLAMERKKFWRYGQFIAAEPLYIRPPDAQRRKVKSR